MTRKNLKKSDDNTWLIVGVVAALLLLKVKPQRICKNTKTAWKISFGDF